MYGKPEIVNTDQGGQYTSDEFSSFVINSKVKLSMDGKGRATDNAFIESLWKTVKYEKIYPNPPENGLDLYQMLEEYFDNYNNERRHSKIDDMRPRDLYIDQLKAAA